MQVAPTCERHIFGRLIVGPYYASVYSVLTTHFLVSFDDMSVIVLETGVDINEGKSCPKLQATLRMI